MNETGQFFNQTNLNENFLDKNIQTLRDLQSSLSTDSIVCVYESPTQTNNEDNVRYLESDDEDLFFNDIKCEPQLSSCSSSIVYMCDIESDQQAEKELHYLEDDVEEDVAMNSDTFTQNCVQNHELTESEDEEEVSNIKVIIDDDIPLNDYLVEVCNSENDKILADADLNENNKQMEIDNVEEKKSIDNTHKNQYKSYFNWLF